MSEDELPEEPENVRGRPAAVALSLTVLGIIVCAIVVWLMHPGANGAEGGKVFAPDFDQPSPFEQTREAQATALDTWTWADPQHTRVKLPVNVAIDRYLAGGAR